MERKNVIVKIAFERNDR